MSPKQISYSLETGIRDGKHAAIYRFDPMYINLTYEELSSSNLSMILQNRLKVWYKNQSKLLYDVDIENT
jgi:hypothetical protein